MNVADIQSLIVTHGSFIRVATEQTADPSHLSITLAKDSSFDSQCVLATCQSLTILNGEVVGDPLEKACLNAINWTLSKGKLNN